MGKRLYNLVRAGILSTALLFMPQHSVRADKNDPCEKLEEIIQDEKTASSWGFALEGIANLPSKKIDPNTRSLNRTLARMWKMKAREKQRLIEACALRNKIEINNNYVPPSGNNSGGYDSEESFQKRNETGLPPHVYKKNGIYYPEEGYKWAHPDDDSSLEVVRLKDYEGVFIHRGLVDYNGNDLIDEGEYVERNKKTPYDPTKGDLNISLGNPSYAPIEMLISLYDMRNKEFLTRRERINIPPGKVLNEKLVVEGDWVPCPSMKWNFTKEICKNRGGKYLLTYHPSNYSGNLHLNFEIIQRYRPTSEERSFLGKMMKIFQKWEDKNKNRKIEINELLGRFPKEVNIFNDGFIIDFSHPRIDGNEEWKIRMYKDGIPLAEVSQENIIKTYAIYPFATFPKNPLNKKIARCGPGMYEFRVIREKNWKETTKESFKIKLKDPKINEERKLLKRIEPTGFIIYTEAHDKNDDGFLFYDEYSGRNRNPPIYDLSKEDLNAKYFDPNYACGKTGKVTFESYDSKGNLIGRTIDKLKDSGERVRMLSKEKINEANPPDYLDLMRRRGDGTYRICATGPDKKRECYRVILKNAIPK